MASYPLPPSPVKSEHSRTSITLKLPNAQGDKGQKVTREQHRTVIQQPYNTPLVQPQHTTLLSDNEVNRIIAARVIERTWLRYRDREMFKLLKHALVAAEHSLSYEILRKVSPQEARFLKDPSTLIRIRFRFGGQEFPPMIFFKIFSNSNGMGVKYFSGKRMIRPASEAAQDACDLMGNRKFLEQMIQDALLHEQFRITDEMDVTTLKDYMQYLSNLDETPATLGGRDNLWRKLTLDVLPRTTILYDVVDYMYQSHKLSSQLRQELPRLLSRPVTQDVQVEHIRIISQLRSPPPPPSAITKPSKGAMSGRRTRQARERAIRMRRAYLTKENENADIDKLEAAEGEEEWEEEANLLFEWSQELNIDDTVGTPRLYDTPQLPSLATGAV